MTRADALKDALTKVEAETARSADFMAAFPQRHEHWDEDCAAHAQSAYLGSLDAAKALHEAVLPGWRLSISQPEIPEIGITFTAIVWPSERGTREHYFRPYAESETPTRSWLIAILKALIATEDN